MYSMRTPEGKSYTIAMKLRSLGSSLFVNEDHEISLNKISR
jgi:hypothetical protein